ncbi:hypothetical protein MRX96_027544 [Rhipicephalus microplus]
MSTEASAKTLNVLIGCTGSVASVKIPLLVQQLLAQRLQGYASVDLKVVATNRALHFFDRLMIPRSVPLLVDEDEWSTWRKMSDPVLHIELRRWADVMVVAPLDANTMAKIANGLCDNLLTCVVRAWDLKKPLLFCPAMNTHMWCHPITAQHVNTLTGLGFTEVPCVEKKLACGDRGYGGHGGGPHNSELRRGCRLREGAAVIMSSLQLSSGARIL